MFRRTIATITVLSMVISPLTPLAGAAAARTGSRERVAPAAHKAIEPVVAKAAPTPTDWSAVDWDTPITLAADVNASAAALGKTDSAQALERAKNVAKHRLSDEDMLARLNAPLDVQNLVRAYRVKRDNLEATGAGKGVLTNERQMLASAIQALYPGKGITAPTEELHVVNIQKTQKISPHKLKPARHGGDPTLGSERVTAPITNRFQILTGESFRTKPKPAVRQSVETSTQLTWWQRLFGVGEAKAGSPLIAYAPGIESRPLDYMMYYLSTAQNVDGSFGETDTFRTTYYTVMALTEVGRIDSDQYAAAVNYLSTTTPSNNRERALKARILWAQNKPFKTLLDDVVATVNEDGGFGMDAGNASDVLTTDEVALTMYLTDYGLQKELPQALGYLFGAIEPDGSMYYAGDGNPSYYLINQTLQTFYPMRSLSVGNNQQQISVQSKITLLLDFLKTHYDAQTVSLNGAGRVIDTLGTIRSWRMYGVETEAMNALSGKVIASQQGNGSFDDAIEPTVMALLALKAPDATMVSLASVGNLENKQTATFEITIKNNGYDTIRTTTLWGFVNMYEMGWKLSILTGNNALAPGATAKVQISVPDTYGMLGAMDVRFYVEDSHDLNFDDNWINKSFTFAAAGNNTPALPLWYSIFQYANNGSAGLAFRYPTTTDANRKNNVVLWREAGTNDWNYYYVNPNWTYIAIAGVFNEGSTYETAVGSLYNDGQTILYYNDLVPVKVSGDASKYNGTLTGSVLDGEQGVASNIVGPFSGTTSDASGTIVPTLTINGSMFMYVSDYEREPLMSPFRITPGATTSAKVFAYLKADAIPPTTTVFSILNKQNFIVKNQKTVQLHAEGTDNVGVKEASFYLWNPNNQYWEFIGSTAALNRSTADLYWYVPADLLGPGFKARVVLYDYRGNASAPKEWGPFEIIDATPPSFNFISPASSSVWQLGATGTIQWNTVSQKGVSKVSLRSVYQNNVDYIRSNIQNTGSYDWVIPFSSTYLGTQVQIYIEGTDANNETGSAVSDTFTIVDSSPTPAAPWSMASLMPAPEVRTSSAQVSKDWVRVQNGTNGDTYVVYHETIDDVVGSPRLITQKLYFLTRHAGVWSQPSEMYSEVFAPVNGSFEGYTPISDLAMALDPQNHPVLTWIKNVSGNGCAPLSQQEIMTMAFDGNSWSAPSNLSNNNTFSQTPAMSISAQGTVAVAWIDGQTVSNACQFSGPREVYVRLRSNGVWGPVQHVSPQTVANNPHVAFTPQGTLYLSYRDLDTQIIEQSWNGNSWSGPTTMLATSTLSFTAYAIAPNGTRHVAAQKTYYDAINDQNAPIILYTSASSGVWAAPQVVSPARKSGDSFSFPQLIFTTRNNPIVTFESYNSNQGKKSLMGTAQNAPGRWSMPAAITPASHYFTDQMASVASYGALGTAAWVANYSFMPEVFISDADLQSDVIAPDPVSGLSATTTLSHIRINWDTYVDAYGDFDHYALYRSATTNTLDAVRIKTNADILNNRFVDDTGTPGRVYYYGVTTIDKTGNESKPLTLVGPTVYPEFNGVVYEDAEDGLVSRWQRLGNTGQNAITNVADDGAHNRAIEIANSDYVNNNYALRKSDGVSAWNNTTDRVLSFDLQTQGPIRLFVGLNTNQGTKYIMYSFTYPVGPMFGGRYYSFNLDPSLKDGAWHTVVRDLVADAAVAFPGAQILSVEEFIGGGTLLRLDNISLTSSQLVHSITGTIVDENAVPLPGISVTLGPASTTAVTDNNGAFHFTQLPGGTYTITPHDTDRYFTPTSSRVVITNDNIEVQFVAHAQDTYIYEDAEDGTVQRWRATGPIGQNTITNVADDQAHNRAIEIISPDYYNYNYELLDASGAAQWHNTKATNFSFDLKTAGNIRTFVQLTTDQGTKFLMYSFNGSPGPFAGRYYSILLDPALKDGAWHTIARDLAADSAIAFPGAHIIAVEEFIAAGTSMRVDNVKLATKNLLFTITGSVADGKGVPLAGAVVTLNPGAQTVVTDQNGAYTFANLLAGSYALTPSKQYYSFAPASSSVQIAQSNQVVNFVGTKQTKFVYEDAEDGTVQRWKISGPGGQNSITNVADDQAHNRAIEVVNPDYYNFNYELKDANGSSLWGNAAATNFSFDLKTQNQFRAFVQLTTDQGTKFLMYSFNYPVGPFAGRYYSFNLDQSWKDGTWHTVARDLAADSAIAFPGAHIQAVEQFIIGSPGARVDNVFLSSDGLLHTVSGTITDDHNAALGGITVLLTPGNTQTTTDVNGAYSFSGLSAGTYTLAPSSTDYLFTPPFQILTVTTSIPNVHFNAAAITTTVYEDAEDGTVARWKVSGPGGQNTITNVADDQAHNRVIEIIEVDPINYNYYLYGADGISAWGNTKFKQLSFDLKTAAETRVFVGVQTNIGPRYIMYSFNSPSGHFAGNYYSLQLDPNLKDNAWHTVVRDLMVDMAVAFPGESIQSVDGLIAGGFSVRLDNIMLKK